MLRCAVLMTLLCLGLGSSLAQTASVDQARKSDSVDPSLLSGLPAEPWRKVPNTSRQFFPIFVGGTPLGLTSGQKPVPSPSLPSSLRALAERQAELIRQTIGSPAVELLIWPTQDWNGQPNWVYARYRTDPNAPWQFLVDGENWLPFWNQTVGEKPLLPQRYFPGHKEDAATLFADFLQSDDLYFQPQFGNCVYVDRATDSVVLKWPHPDSQSLHEKRLTSSPRYVAYCMNQPARYGRDPYALVLRVLPGRLLWPPLLWQNPPHSPTKIDDPLRIGAFPSDFESRIRADLRIFSGVDSVTDVKTGVSRRFVKKGAFQPDHDLGHMVDYLEQRYARLGIKTERQPFVWRGIAQSNLLAKLPGTPRPDGKPLPKVILADHIDTAVEEDTFEKTGRRVTCPGADDNATATAVLLRTAELLRDLPRPADIWLVHLTGEEFPSDDLGAWRFAEKLITDRVDVRAIVISDYIGWHRTDSLDFQISPNRHPSSLRHAALALDAARKLAPPLHAHYVPRHHQRNAVFQTDLQVFEFLGYPGLLFNERVDYSSTTEQNPYNHSSADTMSHVDVSFAATIAKVMMETIARIASEPSS